MADLEKLSRRLAYTFSKPELLSRALTHRSYSSDNNERLEFLGDAVLGFIISEELFRRFPDATEGQLSRLRSQLVKGDTLGHISVELGLGEHIYLGSGELKSGGRRRHSILANTFEAVLGALFLDADIAVTRDFVLRQFSQRLDQCNPRTVQKDPKTQLQEFLQARGLELPAYEVTEVTGSAHNQKFTVRCVIEHDGKVIASEGSGSSRRKAEQSAAEKTLHELEQAV
jgi:ribonuclease-3